jgi:DNA (cytosine-5)-methyltransferase 1
MGYYRAGFLEIVGVDIKPQKNYPFDFIQMDALELGSPWFGLVPFGFDLIHASPPCQLFSAYRRRGGGVGDKYKDLIAPTRELLQRSGVPYVIENVPGAPLIGPVRLCGTSFPSLEVRRHRIFEANFPIPPKPCHHGRLTERKYPGSTNRPNGRTVCNIGEYRVPLEIQKKAIGIDWMTLPELSQAIPPAYTKYIGEAFLAQLEEAA